ncbi:MAG TPA: MgtC/SapB family protein, partial [Candidatus Tumulicola sp.]
SGVSVSGLNTAATIWSTAAFGAIAGFGYFYEALAGAFAIVFLNMVLQPLTDWINARTGANHKDESETTV